MKKSKFGYSFLGTLALAQPHVATAQTKDSSVSSQPGDPREIVVTAQKRAENVQDVPKQVEVISPERLKQSGVYSIRDLGRVSPSVQGIGSGNAPAIRGISSFAFSIGVQAQTGIVLDDVPQPTYSNLAT